MVQLRRLGVAANEQPFRAAPKPVPALEDAGPAGVVVVQGRVPFPGTRARCEELGLGAHGIRGPFPRPVRGVPDTRGLGEVPRVGVELDGLEVAVHRPVFDRAGGAVGPVPRGVGADLGARGGGVAGEGAGEPGFPLVGAVGAAHGARRLFFQPGAPVDRPQPVARRGLVARPRPRVGPGGRAEGVPLGVVKRDLKIQVDEAHLPHEVGVGDALLEDIAPPGGRRDGARELEERGLSRREGGRRHLDPLVLRGERPEARPVWEADGGPRRKLPEALRIRFRRVRRRPRLAPDPHGLRAAGFVLYVLEGQGRHRGGRRKGGGYGGRAKRGRRPRGTHGAPGGRGQ